MRFADGPTIHAERLINAPIEAVWGMVVNINLPADHSDELQRTEWVGDVTDAALGARFRGYMDARGTQWDTECEITDFEPPHRFEWTVLPIADDEEPVATWWFELSSDADGATRATQHVRLGPGRSGLTLAIDANPDREELIIERRLSQQQAAMQRNLDAIAESLEGSP